MCLLDPKNNGVRQTTTTATSTTINDMHVSCNKSFSQSDRDSLYDCYDLELNAPTRRRANAHSKSNDELNEMGGRVRLAYYACAGMWPSNASGGGGDFPAALEVPGPRRPTSARQRRAPP